MDLPGASPLPPIVLGAVLGGLLAPWAHKGKPGREIRLVSLGLVVAALIYIGLALAAGADPRWLTLEAAGLGMFGILAWLGLRASLWWLVLGWLAHTGWDVGLHLDRVQGFVPTWYPLLCVGFDLVVAGYLLEPASSGRLSRTEAAP